MLAVIASIIVFICTLPLKALQLSLTTAIHTYKLKMKVDEKLKQSKGEAKPSVVERVKNKVQPKDAGDAAKKVAMVGMKAAMLAVKSLQAMLFAIKFLIHLINLCVQVVAWLIEFIIFICMHIVVVLIVAAVVVVLIFSADMFSGRSWSHAVYGSAGSVLGSSSSVNYASGDIMTSLETVTKWYIEHVSTYQGEVRADKDTPSKASEEWKNRQVTINGVTAAYSTFVNHNGGRSYYPCDLFGSFDDGFVVGDDCSGFAHAYICWLLQDWHAVPITSTASMTGSGSWHDKMLANGFICIKVDANFKVSELVPGDIMVGYKAGSFGHAEVYVSPTETFGWGAARNAYWRKYTLTLAKIGSEYGLQMGAWEGYYQWIYRYVGR